MPTSEEKIMGRGFWTDGYYVATVSGHGNEQIISKYVKEQGQEKTYKTIYKNVEETKQYSIWDYM